MLSRAAVSLVLGASGILRTSLAADGDGESACHPASNGGFEAFEAGTNSGASSPFANWTVTAGRVNASMNGDGDHFCALVTPGSGVQQQLYGLSPGGEYSIQFLAAAHPWVGDARQLSVYVNNLALVGGTDIAIPGSSSLRPGVLTFTVALNFTAASRNLLAFENAAPISESTTVFIDQVEICERAQALTPGYRFLHDGHCASGYIMNFGNVRSVEVCASRCAAYADCGYFAYAEGISYCAFYLETAGCADDESYMEYDSYVLTTTEVAPWAPEGDCPRSYPYLTTNNSMMPGKLCWDNAQGFDGGEQCDDWCLLPRYEAENPGGLLDNCPGNVCTATFHPLPAPEGVCPSDHPYLQTPNSLEPGKLCWDNSQGFHGGGSCQNWCLLPRYAAENPGGHLDNCPDNVCSIRTTTPPPPLDERGNSGGSDGGDMPMQNTDGKAEPSAVATTAAVVLGVTVFVLLLFTFRRRLHYCRQSPKRRKYHGLSVMTDATPGHDGIYDLQPGRRNDVWESRNAGDDDVTSGEV